MKNITTRQIAEAGIFIAISLVFDYISQILPFRIWAQGGSIHIAHLPIVLYSIRNVKKESGLLLGILVGVAARSMVMLWAPSGVFHPLSAVLDFILVGAIFGCVGVINKTKFSNYAQLSIIFFGLIALFSHIVSGVVIFHVFMPDVFLGIAMNNFWVYSTLYNATHMIPNITLLVLLYSFLPKRFTKTEVQST
jgi:thiamine transporter ThiT